MSISIREEKRKVMVRCHPVHFCRRVIQQTRGKSGELTMRTRKFLDAGWNSSKLHSHCRYYRGIQGETLQLIETSRLVSSLLSRVFSFPKFEMWCARKISPGSIRYCPEKSKNTKIFEFGVVNHISPKNFHPDPDLVKSMYFLHFL